MNQLAHAAAAPYALDSQKAVVGCRDPSCQYSAANVLEETSPEEPVSEQLELIRPSPALIREQYVLQSVTKETDEKVVSAVAMAK